MGGLGPDKKKSARAAPDTDTHARRSQQRTRSQRGMPLYARTPNSELGTVRVRSPELKREDEQTWYLHSKVDRATPIIMYAVPRSKLSFDAAGKNPVPAVPDAVAPTTAAPTPTTAPPPTPVPDIPAGTTLYGPDHVPVTVLGAEHGNVIVEGTHVVHYAVGAGSCVLVEAGGHLYLFDAGVNHGVSHEIAAKIGERIFIEAKGRPIRAVFLTHGHFDHVALLRWIANRVRIDAVVVNPRQMTREEYVEARDKMVESDSLRRQKIIDDRVADAAERATWEEEFRKSGDDRAVKKGGTEQAWREEVTRRVTAEQPLIRELAALPVDGGKGFDTLETRIAATGEPAPTMTVEDLLPTSEKAELKGVVDKGMRGHERDALPDTDVVDTMSTTFVLSIDGRDLVVMPDLRRTDIKNIRDGLRDALGTKAVAFREWVIGHHMQIGFVENASAKTMLQLLEILHSFRASERNAVMASVDPKLVRPEHLKLLRLLGFETFLAESAADIRTYEIMAGAKRIRGVRAPLPPESKGAPTLERSIVQRKVLNDELADVKTRLTKTKGKGTGPQQEALRAERKGLQNRIQTLTDAEHALVDAVRADPHDATAEKTAHDGLVELLKTENAPDIVTSSSHLTDTALVILREPFEDSALPEDTAEGKARARDLSLRTQKGKVAVRRLAAEHATPEARQEAYAELYAELLEYKAQLKNAAGEHGPGVTQDIIEAELANVDANVQALEKSLHARTEVTRLPDGALAETKVIKVEARPDGTLETPRMPSPASMWLLKQLERGGRFLGGVMVISTITGSKDLIDRYEEGHINAKQFGLGAARQLTSGVVGLRMLGGLKVNSSTFVVISMLEIGEAMVGDYDYGAQRDRAINHAVRSSVVNLGCMYVGEALIATANPIGIVAGAIVMFLGPIIINALFGDDTPESLFPSEITDVEKRLVELVAQYRIIVGGLSLEKRGHDERTQLGFDPGADPDTDYALQETRMRALYLESLIVPEFEAAYKRARGGRAGLHELDEMRRQFLLMRAQASTDEMDEATRGALQSRADLQSQMPGQGLGHAASPDVDPIPEGFTIPQVVENGRVVPIRELTLRRLEAAEANLFTITVDEVNKMEQWTSIRKESTALVEEFKSSSPDWAEISRRQRDLEARLSNARYRIDPAAQAPAGSDPARTDPLLTPGSAARSAYDTKLAAAEKWVQVIEMFVLQWHFRTLRGEHEPTPNIEALWNEEPGKQRYSTFLDKRFAFADDALDLYESMITEIEKPPASVGDAETLYREPSARVAYREAIKKDAKFRKRLVRLELNETAAISLLRSLQIPPEQDADNAHFRAQVSQMSERFLTLKNQRKEKRGILFAQEVDELDARQHQHAVAYYAPLLGQAAKPLTKDEIAALQNPLYYVGQGALQRDIASRLEQIPGLRIPVGPLRADHPMYGMMDVDRMAPGIMRLDRDETDKRALVGVVKVSSNGSTYTVIALTADALEKLGNAPIDVPRVRLSDAHESDLKPTL